MNSKTVLIKRLITLSSTIFTSRLMSALTSLISFIFISRVSFNASAAGSLIAVIQVPIFTCATSLLYALSLMFGKAYGAKDDEQLARTIESAIALSVCVTIVICIIFINLNWLLVMLHQPEKLIPEIQSYFDILAFGVFPAILVICLSQYFSAIGTPQVIMKRASVLFPITLLLSYCLILGKLGFSKLGVAGAAYAITVSYWVFFLWLLKAFLECKTTKAFIKKIKVPAISSSFKELIKIGTPIMLQNSTDLIFLFVITLMIGWTGRDSLAMQQVINQLNLFLFLIPFAIAQASSILISQSLGKNNNQELIKFAHTAITSIFCLSIVISLLLVFFRGEVISIYFTNHHPRNNDIHYLLAQLLIMFIIFQFFNALKTVVAGLLRGLHMTKPPMYISLLSNWIIGLPAAYIFGFYFKLGIIGINLGYLISAVISFILMMLCWVGSKNRLLLPKL